MREIKFRARISEEYKGTFSDWQYFTLESAWACNGNSRVIDWSTVCQFTGFLDKKGKEIYEGDLINHISRNDKMPHPVIYSKGSFCGDYGLIYPLFNESFDKYCEIEVIGNIYEGLYSGEKLDKEASDE